MLLSVCLTALILSLGLDDDRLHVHEDPAFEVLLPDATWVVRQEQKNAGFVSIVFSPHENLVNRCSVLRLPSSFLPEGLETREAQISASTGERYERVAMEATTIAEREGVRWEYRVSGFTTIEWAFLDDEAWVVFQIAASPDHWANAESKKAFDEARASFRWDGLSAADAAMVSAATPEDVRTKRAASASAPPLPYSVTQHRIQATVEPKQGSIDVVDEIRLESLQDGVSEIRFYVTIVTVVDVVGDSPLKHRMESIPNADVLIIDLEEPLDEGDVLNLEVQLTCEDFISRTDQNLIAEIAFVGQIRERSSWSSHVLWYPMDERNDAAMDITFDVPAPYTAVTGGALKESSESEGRRRFRYVEPHRTHRLLPFGFAVGDYVSMQGKSEAGLAFTVYGFRGEEKRIKQRVDTLEAASKAFERAFGPLPWSDVRFVHVTPLEKETGVSLPGMILVSDGYFPDIEGVDLSDGDLSRPGGLGVLVIADELSHQWNIYASSFPNELGEGLSTYTNALFVEARHGHEAYLRTIGSCRDTWLSTAGLDVEYAVADIDIYSSGLRYRPVVFCKTPVVLQELRRLLGDEAFFDGLRRGFQNRDDVDGFVRLQRGFEEATGEDQTAFFDQWFYRAGFPRLRSRFDKTTEGVTVRIEQIQKEDPYSMELEVVVTCEDGSLARFEAELTEREQAFTWKLDSPPVDVEIGPEFSLPATVEKIGQG